MHGMFGISFKNSGRGQILIDTKELTIELSVFAFNDNGKFIGKEKNWRTRSKKKLFNILRHNIGDIPSYEYKRYLDFIDRLEEKDKLENKE